MFLEVYHNNFIMNIKFIKNSTLNLFYIMMIVSKERNMNYNIVIEYTDNAERAGKLTLTDDKGQVVLSKVPVAIPSAILNYPSVEHDNLQFRKRQKRFFSSF
jgi:hypothetical protein